MRRSLVGHLFAVGCLVAGLSSCDDDSVSPSDWSHIGAVHGYVLAAGQPLTYGALLTLRSADPAHDPQVRITVSTDTTGYYEISAPAGAYVLSAIAGRAPGIHVVTGDEPQLVSPQSLELSRVPRRLDIPLGRVTIDLSTPAVLDGHLITMQFEPVEGNASPGAYASATARDGYWPRGALPLAPGTYRLKANVANGEFYLPGTLDPAQALRLEVGVDEPVTLSLALGEPWLLRGQITGAWQSLGLHAPHLYGHASDSTSIASVTATSDGSFEIALFVQQAVRLHLFDGHTPRWVGGASFADAAVFSGAPGESVAVPPLVFSAIECRILPPVPLEGYSAECELIDTTGTAVTREGCRVINENPLILPYLDPGTYFLRMAPEGIQGEWCAQWFDGVDDVADATPIEVPPEGGVARVTMTLSTCGAVSGRVREPGGSPAGRRRVELFTAEDPSQGAEPSRICALTDDETGEFTLGRLHDGSYRLGVRRTAMTLDWYPGTLEWNEADVITLAGYARITDLEWTLTQ